MRNKLEIWISERDSLYHLVRGVSALKNVLEFGIVNKVYFDKRLVGLPEVSYGVRFSNLPCAPYNQRKMIFRSLPTREESVYFPLFFTKYE